jgi:hypothetical protein
MEEAAKIVEAQTRPRSAIAEAIRDWIEKEPSQ